MAAGAHEEDRPAALAEETITAGPLALAAAPTSRAYLLVVENGSSSLHDLPRSGFVLVGRADEAELHLEHASVSRRHARITVEAGAARILDLGSHNGTRVNGELLEGSRQLARGDVVAVGEVVLVVHTAPAPRPARALLDEAQLRARLAAEVDRALSFQRPLAIVAVAGVPAATRAVAGAAAAAGLRGLDLFGVGEDGLLVAILPELAPCGVPAAARRLLAALAPAPEARAGLACCPGDGCDVDDLLLVARVAARAAAPGAVADAEATAVRLELGERTVLLAHPAMLRVYELIRRLAAADLPVLVTGETGVGKEHAAFAVHHHSPRARGPFVALSCAALPETLVEATLFGHERGAFTGADVARPGVLEAASGGTLFLDEVGELAPTAQAKLLRALESRSVTRLGDHRERPVDVRLVAATNRNLASDVRAGRFRQDLYFRLGAATVVVPPLRERRCEIPLLARAFLGAARARAGQPPVELEPEALQALLLHAWPGNVRELRNVMDFIAATVDGAVQAADVRRALGEPPEPLPEPAPAPGPTAQGNLAEELRTLERRRMVEALETSGGVRTRAAALLGMPIRTFTWKLRHHGLGEKER